MYDRFPPPGDLILLYTDGFVDNMEELLSNVYIYIYIYMMSNTYDIIELYVYMEEILSNIYRSHPWTHAWMALWTTWREARLLALVVVSLLLVAVV